MLSAGSRTATLNVALRFQKKPHSVAVKAIIIALIVKFVVHCIFEAQALAGIREEATRVTILVNTAAKYLFPETVKG